MEMKMDKELIAKEAHTMQKDPSTSDPKLQEAKARMQRVKRTAAIIGIGWLVFIILGFILSISLRLRDDVYPPIIVGGSFVFLFALIAMLFKAYSIKWQIAAAASDAADIAGLLRGYCSLETFQPTSGMSADFLKKWLRFDRVSGTGFFKGTLGSRMLASAWELLEKHDREYYSTVYRGQITFLEARGSFPGTLRLVRKKGGAGLVFRREFGFKKVEISPEWDALWNVEAKVEDEACVHALINEEVELYRRLLNTVSIDFVVYQGNAILVGSVRGVNGGAKMDDPQKVRAAYEAAYDVLFREDIPVVDSTVFPNEK